MIKNSDISSDQEERKCDIPTEEESREAWSALSIDDRRELLLVKLVEMRDMPLSTVLRESGCTSQEYREIADREFMRDLGERSILEVSAPLIPKILESNVESAKRGDHNAQKLFMNITGITEEKTEININTQLQSMDDSALIAKLERLKNQLNNTVVEGTLPSPREETHDADFKITDHGSEDVDSESDASPS